MKNSAICVSNIMLGIAGSFLGFYYLIFTTLKLESIYKEMEVEVEPNFLIPKIILLVFGLIGVMNIGIGLWGLIKNKSLKPNIILLATLLLTFVAFPVLTYFTVAPIFNLVK